jgi:hypothetical protein
VDQFGVGIQSESQGVTPEVFRPAPTIEKTQKPFTPHASEGEAMKQRILAVIRTLCMVGTLGLIPLTAMAESYEPSVGQRHPDFTLPSSGGIGRAHSQLR